PLLSLLTRAMKHRTRDQIILNRKFAEQAAALGHVRNAPPNDLMRTQGAQRYILLAEPRTNLAVRNLEQPRNRTSQRGLARSVRTDERKGRTSLHSERRAIYDLRSTEKYRDIAYLKHRPRSPYPDTKPLHARWPEPPGGSQSRSPLLHRAQ